MNVAKERRTIELVLESYRQELDTFTEDAFTATPPMGGWSYAEVYDHIMQASMASCVALERCTQNNCPPSTKGINLIGRFVMLAGIFPPVKIKVPEKVAAKMPAKKISREDAKNLIIKCRKQINSVADEIKGASPQARIKHPRLGMLNAGQWLKFIRIHLQHHLKQLNRIKKNLVQ